MWKASSGPSERAAFRLPLTVDVRPVVDLRRRDAVTAAVARQEDQRDAAQLAEEQLVGRCPEGRLDLLPARAREAVELVDAAAAHDAHDPLPALCHGRLP